MFVLLVRSIPYCKSSGKLVGYEHCKHVDGLLFCQMDQEDLYQNLTRIVESMNVIVASYCDEDGPLGNVQMDPADCTVGFGSGLHGWAFTLKQFAEIYAAKFKIEPAKLTKRLWGDHFYCQSQHKWSTSKGEGLVRGFCQFVLDPIYKVDRKNVWHQYLE